MTLFLYEGFGQKTLMCYFAVLLMKNIPQPYSFFNHVSAIMMIVALLWLTISAPFVFEQQQKIAKENSSSCANFPIAGNEEEPPIHSAVPLKKKLLNHSTLFLKNIFMIIIIQNIYFL